MHTPLGEHLETLYSRTDASARLRADPVWFPHRYERPADQEIAGLLAAQLAYGRVSLFWPVLTQLVERMDVSGGPRAYLDALDLGEEAAALSSVVYRWNRHPDFLLLFATLARVYDDHESLGVLFEPRPGESDIGPALVRGVEQLRATAVRIAPGLGIEAQSFSDLPRGFRYFLPSPSGGSACKRWNMYLRWMVRPTDEGIDLGLWDVPTRLLVMPVDVHVLRIARLIGLTSRTTGSWRTALEITEALRAFDPEDPIRFDFAIAHLGISGACRGFRDPEICPSCPLDPVCCAG